MQEENKSPEGNLRDIYYVLFRHIKEMVIFFIVIVAAVTLIMYFVPNFYISTAKLRLKPGRESVILVPTPATGQTMSINQPIGYEINSELEILRSREIAEKVADSVGVKVILNFSDEVAVRDISNIRQTYDARKKNSKESNSTLSYPEELSNSLDLVGELLMRERAARTIMENLVIDIRSSSNIISLSYKARSSKLAYEVLSKFIEYYLEMRSDVQGASNTYEFYVEQTEEMYNKLTETQNVLRDLKNKTGIASLDEQRSIQMRRVSELKQEKETTDSEIFALISKINELQRILSSLPETIDMNMTIIENPVYTQLRDHYYQLKLEEKNLLTKYTKESQIVKNIQQQIAETDSMLSLESPTITRTSESVTAALQDVQTNLVTEKANLKSLQAKSEKIAQQYVEAQKDLTILNDNEKELMKLEKELEIRNNSYNEFKKNLEQARIDKAMIDEKISNLSVLEEPNLPIEKSGPPKKRNVFAGFFFAFFGSIGLAFFLEYIDNTIKTPEDVKRKLNLNALVVIADCPQKKDNLIN